VGKNAKKIGLISDTHGLLRPEALRALRGCDLIIHAGDVGKPDILEALNALAPVTAVSGNIEQGPQAPAWALALPETAIVAAGEVSIYILHDLQQLDLDPRAAGFHIVVSGHSHKPLRRLSDGILYINPGSAGPQRFQLPITVARLDLGLAPWTVEFIDLVPAH
jgi:uncharacterized protein